jgi:hypothetical protein
MHKPFVPRCTPGASAASRTRVAAIALALLALGAAPTAVRIRLAPDESGGARSSAAVRGA